MARSFLTSVRVPNRGDPLKTEPNGTAAGRISPASTEEATLPPRQFAWVPEDEPTIVRCLGAQVLTAALRRILRLTGNKADGGAF
jgi:hypothetical protein